jgi:uncharacterized membrane protein
MAEANTSSPTGSYTGLRSNVAAALCAVFPLFGGIIFYFIETKDLFVRHWAVQSIFFGAAWLGSFLVITVLLGILSSFPGTGMLFTLLMIVLCLLMIVPLIGGILWIAGVIKAFQGQKWEYPVTSKLGKRYFPNLS